MKQTLVALVLLCAGLLVVPANAACPPEGVGGDAIANRLKNRTTAPASYREMTVEQFLQEFTPNLHTPRSRAKVSVAHRQDLDAREQLGVALVGYLLSATQSWPEEANCNDPARRDVHVWIGATRPHSVREGKAMRAQAVIVEPTPAGQDAHETWRVPLFQRLAKDGVMVRVSGWAMYDAAHPKQVGKTRATLWEVHPITKIEVFSGGQWRELE